MKLFKLRLTDPIIRHGKQLRCTYIVMARTALGAVGVLREEQPEAFRYNPEVDVQPYLMRTVRTACIMVERSKTPRNYGNL